MKFLIFSDHIYQRVMKATKMPSEKAVLFGKLIAKYQDAYPEKSKQCVQLEASSMWQTIRNKSHNIQEIKENT
jgi:hypothetical protein